MRRNVLWIGIIIILYLLPSSNQAQNLVPNGNFEKHYDFNLIGAIPKSNINFLYDWEPNGLWDYAAYCHRDFVKKYGQKRMAGLRYINFDTLNLLEGHAMVKLSYFENDPDLDTGAASYIKTKLIEPLELGDVYEVSMWVYTKIDPGADTMVYTHIGMFLTRHEIFWKTENRISTDYFFGSKIIPGQWTEIKWYIRALCSLQYLTIGVFRDSTFPSMFRMIDNPVFYYVDKVSIKKVNEDSLSAEIHPTPYCEYYEKENKDRIMESITSHDVHFESNSSTLDPHYESDLDSFYQANLTRKNKIFVIIGHTDNRAAENISLSKARAESVKSYLHQKYNINELNMLVFGLGSAYPVADNLSATGRLQNRRATIRTSDLVISQIFYRKGLDYISADRLQQAYFQFSRWLRMVPMAKKVEMLVDRRLINLKHSPYWQPLVTEIRKGYSLYYDAKAAFSLDSLYFEDQVFRFYSPYNLSGYIPEIDTVVLPEFKITDEEHQQKDSINFLAIQKYLVQYGYPEISKVGRRQARGLGYIILHHFDSLTFIKYIPIIKNLCMNGEAEWDVFAKMTDKLHIIRHEPQEYGTQYELNSKRQVVGLYKIDNIEEVNRRRARIGMPPTSDSINSD